MQPMLATLRDTGALAARWLRLELPHRPDKTSRVAGRAPKLVLLAWALPPSSNAGVHRPLSLLRYGPAQGWRVDAFHGEAPADQRQHGNELLARVPPAVRLHCVADSSLHPSYRLTPQIDGGFKNAVAFAQTAIEKLAGDPPDAIMASGPPFFTFVAALFVAHHFGVPLVLDYRDEWSECPFDFVSHGPHDRWWEQRCLRAASAVLFTTESHRLHQLSTFTSLRPEVTHVVPNGWEADDFEPLRIDARDNGVLTLAHIGNLAGHTPPDAFLTSLQAMLDKKPEWLKRIRVQLIGRRSPNAALAIRNFAYPDILEVVDHVSKREANRRMIESSALLLIATPDLQRYLPGKLFDYIAARRPVLVFGAAGEAATVVQHLGLGLLCPPGDPAALASALERLTDLRTDSPKVDAWLAARRRDTLAAQMFSVVQTLMATR